MAENKTLVQRIALLGGKDIERDLDAIGKSAVRSFSKLQSDFKAIGDRMSTLGKSITSAAAKFSGLSVAVGAAGYALGGFIKSAADAADQQAKMAQKVGISQKSYAGLAWAFEQSDISAQDFQGAIAKMVKTMKAGATGFNGLRVVAQQGITDQRVMDQLLALSDLFASMPDGLEKDQLALKYFGRAGLSMIPAMNQGSAAIRALMKEAKALGLQFTDAESKIGDDFGDALGRLTKASIATKHHLGLLFAPALTEAIDELTIMLVNNRKVIMDWGKQMSESARVIVEDFVRVLQGEQAQTETMQNLIGVYTAVKEAGTVMSTALVAAFRVLVGAANAIAAPFNFLFGTSIQGNALAIVLVVGYLTGAFRVLYGAVMLVVTALGTNLARAVAATAFAAFASVVGTVAAGFRILAGAITASTVAWSLSPWGRFAAIVTVILTGLYLLATKFPEVFASIKQWVMDAGVAIKEWVVGGLGLVWDKLKGIYASVTTWLSGKWTALKQMAADAFSWVVEVSSNALQSIKSGFATAFDGIKSIVATVFDGITSLASTTMTKVLGYLETMLSKASKLAEGLLGLFSGENDVPGGSTPGPEAGFAQGGHIRGRGTSTSDSMIIRASDGEYMQRAAAVRKYGVGFMNALNSLRIPLGAIRGYASGGLIGGAMPIPALAAASGGQGRANMRPLDLTIGDQRYEGLLAPVGEAERLIQYAINKRARSAGRKPGWYR